MHCKDIAGLLMDTTRVIEHEGTVSEIHGNKATVRFIAKSACAHCQLKGVCSEAEIENKQVEVELMGRKYKVGEKVNIVLAQSLGLKALSYGYLIPFALVIAVLFAVYGVTGDEVISGLSALAVLVPYYGGLYLSRSRIKKGFKFYIRKFV